MTASPAPILNNLSLHDCGLALEARLSEHAFLTFSETEKLLRTNATEIVFLIKQGNLVTKKLINGFFVTAESIQRYVDTAPELTNEELDEYLLLADSENKNTSSVVPLVFGGKTSATNKAPITQGILPHEERETSVDNLNVDFISSYSDKERVIKGYPSLVIRANKKNVILMIKVKNATPLILKELNRDTEITEENLQCIREMYNVFYIGERKRCLGVLLATLYLKRESK